MPRWDYDVTFYRVFCITLLAIAFIFTVILTNVFVDIDGLLSTKDKVLETTEQIFFNEEENQAPQEGEPTEVFYSDDNYIDDNSNWSYRTKRSANTKQRYLNNPKLKMLLTNHVASILEELEHDNLDKAASNTTPPPKKYKMDENILEIIRQNKDLLKLAVNEILHKGIMAHADLHDVYKKIHFLLKSVNRDYENTLMKMYKSKEIKEDDAFISDSHEYFNKYLEKASKTENKENLPDTDNQKALNHKDHNLIIKSVIEIWDQDDRKQLNISNENARGLIKVVYNGKSINVSQINDNYMRSTVTGVKNNMHQTEKINTNKHSEIHIHDTKKILNNYDKTVLNKHINSVIKGMLENYSTTNKINDAISSETIDTKSERNKRQVKMHYANDDIPNPKHKTTNKKTKSIDDDLYVEIETHLDGNDSKDNKRKKFIKEIINKIQNALVNQDSVEENLKRHLKYKKRTQSPIFINKYPAPKSRISPLETIEHRQMGPINKISQFDNISPNKNNIDLAVVHSNPKFLTPSKSVNSAELSKIYINYDEVLQNGIPKRLQAPIATSDNENEEITSNVFNSLGNVSLFLKDIDGTGFSIGFNKYTDEPPDNESLKIFSGLENLIKEYHNVYDEDAGSSEGYDKNIKNFVRNIHEVTKRDVKVHQSIPVYGNKMNTEKISDRLMFHEFNMKNLREKNNVKIHNKESLKRYPKRISLIKPIVIKEKILKKTLIPTELFSSIDMVKRNKRSLNIQKYKTMKLKSKIKVNRYINTNAMSKKKVFATKKRNKRQINAIRIIANDSSVPFYNYSDENAFFASNEETFPSGSPFVEKSGIQNVIIDQSGREPKIMTLDGIPSVGNIYTQNMYSDSLNTNSLMSRYPHVFLDNTPGEYNNAENSDETQKKFKSSYRIPATPKYQTSETDFSSVQKESNFKSYTSGFEEILNAVLPSIPKTHYKVTLKILPKLNVTNVQTGGYKEIHTSVNKTYAKNGMQYITLFNLTKMSKIERLNQTSNNVHHHNLKSNEMLMSLLSNYKKKVDQHLNTILTESKKLNYIFNTYQEKTSNNTNDVKLNKITGPIVKNIKNLSNVITSNYTDIAENMSFLKPIFNMSNEDEKVQMLRSIKQNENITNEILKRIDSNTVVMQNILKQLTDYIIHDKMHMTTTMKNVFQQNKSKIKSYQDNSHSDRRWPFVEGFNNINNNSKANFNSLSNLDKLDKKLPLASVLYNGELFANTLDKVTTNNLVKSPITIKGKEKSNMTTTFYR